MSFFGFGSSAKLELQLDGKRETVTIKPDTKSLVHVPIFQGHEDVTGKLIVQIPAGKKLEHIGIKIEFVGEIELFYDRTNHTEFTSLVREVAPPGTLTETTEIPFEFRGVEKPYESYCGLNARLRYMVRATVTRQYSSKLTADQEVWVQNVDVEEPEINSSIKMEVGIEDCLHIEFEYNKSKYHLQDVVLGKIYFLLVRIKIKHMELAIIKRETAGSGPSVYNESETLTKFEVMDGAPVKGESIPIRLFLSGVDLTPTYRNVNNKFSTKYYLNLVLVDEEDRRYFKQQEIVLWRKEIG